MAVRTSSKIIAVCAALSAGLAGCRNDDHPASKAPVAARVARDTARAKADSTIAGGEVKLDSAAPPAMVWLTDANVLALINTIGARQIAADNVELQTWHSDTIRDFAASMAREHSALIHSVDSVATRIKIAPIAPALAARVFAEMQARTDSMSWQRGLSLDRAYVRHQIGSNAAAAKLAAQLAAVAERPEVQTLATSAAERSKSASTRAKALDAQLAAADSVKADSLAKVQERRKRASKPR